MLQPLNDYHSKKIGVMNIVNIDTAYNLVKDKKCIIVTGVSGQDGSHMVDYLLKNTSDYIIFGGVRRLSVLNHNNISHIEDSRFHLINFDLTDNYTINRIIEKLKPEYFINFAAQSFVGSSWDFANQTFLTNTNSVLNILEAIRLYHPACKFYQAGSSEEFGDVIYSPQDENHPLRPRSPYGASKAASRHLVKVWRESYNLYAVQGWLFNHEGVRRGEEFVTRKITTNVARIKKSLDKKENFKPLSLGNLDSIRDWSDAEDFCDGVWKMLNQSKPKDYVLSSNETHSVREFVELAFKYAGVDGYWVILENYPLSEKFVKNGSNEVLVVISPELYRPAEVDSLQGNSSLARTELNWSPKISFNSLVKKMIMRDLYGTVKFDELDYS